MASIADNWKDFSGAKNWDGLLDHPLNTDFRRYLIHYGERVDAIGAAFNYVTASDSYALSRYPAEDFFMNVNLQNGNPFKYQVTKYFYMKSDGIAEALKLHLEGSAWIGYVAVTTDEGRRVLGRRDILVCWRGTLSDPENIQNLEIDLTPASDIFGATNNPKVHRGFHNAYVAYSEKFKYNKASARTQVLAEVWRLVNMYARKEEEVSITVASHSLGAALATLNGMDIVANGWNKPTGRDKGFPVTVFAYASPRVGDQGFQDVFKGLTDDLHVLRIRNSYDPLPCFPTKVLLGYQDVGDQELEIDSSKSPYLKSPIAQPHNLELYLHAIAGYQGKEEEFKLVVDRDISLLNKSVDLLADKYKIPPKWWAVKNNGMIQMDDGFWKLNDYVPDPPSEKVSLARRFGLVPLGPPLLAYSSNCKAMFTAVDGDVELVVDRPYKAGEPIVDSLFLIDGCWNFFLIVRFIDMASIAENWKDFSGAKNWDGLLDHPLNTDFRRYLIHYGERVEAIGDAFNSVKASDSYALSRYPTEEFFKNVNLQNGNPFKYQVTKYFYLKSEGIAEVLEVDLDGSAWIGYVAVTTDEGRRVLGRRDILVCWRGTILASEWSQDSQFDVTAASDIFGAASNPKVHRGFHNVYVAKGKKSIYNKTSAREQVLAELRRLVDMYALNGEEVSITVAGHSLGAALATLNGMDIVANGFNKPTESDIGYPVTVFAYACPRVGDQGFQDVFNGLTTDLHVLRIKNSKDIVPRFPPVFLYGYQEVGEELEIDSTKSPYLKDPKAKPHDLELYLHTIAGYQGKEEEFKLVVDRDISLLNKSLDLLADKYKIPPTWGAVKNNGMIQIDNGSWKLNDYVPDPPSEADVEGIII
ncbi:hypothetical protein SADUNF_Sadunf15G0022900 [Salix dunnii]|uniref:Phospholipase A1 n=1 Tax=Salix dunnii TaxID=1413687 RepID=A0A835JDL2_9ROSI|nr:hypothetical protein SADUNF_Sadunf15G0022900 [Salix dunnii]